MSDRIKEVASLLCGLIPFDYVGENKNGKLYIRLNHRVFLRERKRGRGIPSRMVNNYFGTDLLLPEILGKIDE